MIVSEVMRIIGGCYSPDEEIAIGYWIDRKRVEEKSKKIGINLTSKQINVVLAALHSKMIDNGPAIEDLIGLEEVIELVGGELK